MDNEDAINEVEEEAVQSRKKERNADQQFFENNPSAGKVNSATKRI